MSETVLFRKGDWSSWKNALCSSAAHKKERRSLCHSASIGHRKDFFLFLRIKCIRDFFLPRFSDQDRYCSCSDTNHHLQVLDYPAEIEQGNLFQHTVVWLGLLWIALGISQNTLSYWPRMEEHQPLLQQREDRTSVWPLRTTEGIFSYFQDLQAQLFQTNFFLVFNTHLCHRLENKTQ